MSGQALYPDEMRTQLWSKSSAHHALKQSTLAAIQQEPMSVHTVTKILIIIQKLMTEIEMNN